MTIASDDAEGAKEAMSRVEALTASVEVGRIYDGRVTSVKDFGAFIEILPGKDGLCHISELSDEYVSSVADVCKVGDGMQVKVIAIDDQDRVKLSRKAALTRAGRPKQRAPTPGDRTPPPDPLPPGRGLGTSGRCEICRIPLPPGEGRVRGRLRRFCLSSYASN